MSGWTKLFSSIVTSSVWVEPDFVVRVWIAMLATADANGMVEGSIPGFANIARVSVDDMREAVRRLSAPDPYSRTTDNEGRRIEAIEAGWRILNYQEYRRRHQGKDGSKAPAMRRSRARREGNVLPEEVTRYPEERREKEEESTHTQTQTDRARGGDHSAHARCFSRFCVPQFLHERLTVSLGTSIENPDEWLDRFYSRLCDKIPADVVIADPLRMVQDAFRDYVAETVERGMVV